MPKLEICKVFRQLNPVDFTEIRIHSNYTRKTVLFKAQILAPLPDPYLWNASACGILGWYLDMKFDPNMIEIFAPCPKCNHQFRAMIVNQK